MQVPAQPVYNNMFHTGPWLLTNSKMSTFYFIQSLIAKRNEGSIFRIYGRNI